MCNAKNNHCVMRKQSCVASGARSGHMQEGGGRNPPTSARHLNVLNEEEGGGAWKGEESSVE